MGDNQTAVCYDARGNGDGSTVPTLTGDHQNRVTDYTALCVGNGQLHQISMSEQSNTLDCMHDQQAVMVRSQVRRLTPLECTRLEGFPDGWVDIGDWTDEKGKRHKEADAPKYRALGNSIALPFWYWLLERISGYCTEKTMGSLFSGIGGFDLCWQMINGDGSCRWGSEIEPFCIAVTTRHFGDEEKGIKGDWMDYVRLGGNET